VALAEAEKEIALAAASVAPVDPIADAAPNAAPPASAEPTQAAAIPAALAAADPEAPPAAAPAAPGASTPASAAETPPTASAAGSLLGTLKCPRGGGRAGVVASMRRDASGVIVAVRLQIAGQLTDWLDPAQLVDPAE
jgi:hypothetical protein